MLEEFASLCSTEVRRELADAEYRINTEPPDAEMTAFARMLGDIGRRESAEFHKKHPETWALIRDFNDQRLKDANEEFRRKLSNEFASVEAMDKKE